jgi:hypothetical protein
LGKLSLIKSRLELEGMSNQLYTTRTKRPALKSLILLSERTPDELSALMTSFRRLQRGFTVKLEPLRDDLVHIRVQKDVRGKPVGGDAIVDYSAKGYWVAYTDESGYFVGTVLEAFFNELYPYVARVYFNYHQLRKFLGEIKSTYSDSTVDSTYLAYKRQRRGGAKGRLLGTRLLWEPNAEEELRDAAKKYRVLFDSLNFQVRNREEMVELEASLTGRGIARLKFGTFTEFYRNVIQLYIRLATEWKEFFSGREKKVEQGKVELRPYVLEYPFDLGRFQIDELMSKLKESYSYSTLFDGNPYFAANLTDYREGSSFYLTILGGKVTITPMIKSTPYALWKIAAAIQRVTGDSEIEDLSTPQRGLEA